MRALDRIATAIVLFLGVGHVAATPRFASGFTEGAAWFAGSGLTLVFVAFLNLSRLASPDADRRLRRLCLIANAVTLVWTVFVATMVPVPQAFLAAAAVLVLTVVTLIQLRKAAKAVR